ncbi:MAG TPA: hypothetical protein VF602_02980, partial [Pedobacter sp.]
ATTFTPRERATVKIFFIKTPRFKLDFSATETYKRRMLRMTTPTIKPIVKINKQNDTFLAASTGSKLLICTICSSMAFWS